MAEHVGIRKGRIDLAVVSTAKYFVPQLLARFREEHPGVDVKLQVMGMRLSEADHAALLEKAAAL